MTDRGGWARVERGVREKLGGTCDVHLDGVGSPNDA